LPPPPARGRNVKPRSPPRRSSAAPPPRRRAPPPRRARGRTSPRETQGAWLRSFHSAPAAGRLVNHLAYALYLPAAAAATRDMPLVVMLHGCKQTAESFAAGTRICRVAARAGFAVLLPEQAKTAHSHRCWNWHGDASLSEAPAIASLVDAIVRERGFDRDRVYLAGTVGWRRSWPRGRARLSRPVRGRRAAPGPAIAPPLSTMAAMSVMRRGLRDDPIRTVDTCVDASLPRHARADRARRARHGRRRAERGAARRRVRAPQSADRRGAGEPRVGEQRAYTHDGVRYTDYLRAAWVIVRVCIVHGLARAWSGGDPREAFHSATGPDATAMFWNFFRRRRGRWRGGAPARPGRALRDRGRVARVRVRPPDRQPHAERRARPRHAGYVDRAAMALDDPVRHRQPEPRTLSDRLRREERIEDPPRDVGAMPVPVSLIAIDTHSPSLDVRIVIMPRVGIACAALTSRFMNNSIQLRRQAFDRRHVAVLAHDVGLVLQFVVDHVQRAA
jgi:poly(3-hydroxybutyrate) depolymerase